MHGLKTLHRINQEAEEARAIVEKHGRLDGQGEGGRPVKPAPESPRERDFLIGYHGDVAVITPLKTKAVQWAYANIREHLGREGIAYVVDRKIGESLEAMIHAQGFGVN